MNKQRGMTFISLVLMIAGIVFVAVIGIKLYPAYAEYFTIKRAFSSLKNQMASNQMSTRQIVDAFNRQREIDGFTSVTGKDLVIAPSADGTVVSVDYEVVTPLVGNVSALMNFSLSTDENASSQKEATQ